jgi:LPS-assembly protein
MEFDLAKISKESLTRILNYNFQIFSIFILTISIQANAQNNNNRVYVFEEDKPESQKNKRKEQQQLTSSSSRDDGEFDFRAPKIDFQQDKKTLKGTGGVLISQSGIQMQADEAEVDTEKKQANLKGNINFSWPEGEISAKEGKVNYERETGEFHDATIQIEQSNFKIDSQDMNKDSDTKYRFFDSSFTTCNCPDGSVPWSIGCSKANMEQDGYAHTYNTTFNINNVPIFYSPYFVVPIKTTRQSGLLVPTYGYNSQNGVRFSQPIYFALDDYSDLTLSPFIETQSRVGLSMDYRKIFSERSNIETRWYYSDESRRDGDLRGTRVDDIYEEDRQFDENRHGGYFKHQWSNEPDSAVPTRLNTDIRYISDDLFLREIDDSSIADANARFTTSQVLMQNSLPGGLQAEIGGEFNQSLVSDDDLIFQRLPEINLSARETFRPFGFNPYGLKTIFATKLTATDFVRKEGYEGWRYNINPSLRVPHHFQNYLNAEFAANMYQTYYNQNEYSIPDSDDLITEDSRRAYTFNYTLGTAVERVYDLPSDSWMSYLASMGADNQTHALTRVKHVIEPFVGYNYTPFTDQDGLPLYDSLDRIRQRSLVSYGFRTSLLGKFEPLSGSNNITEITPDISDFQTLDPGMGLGSDNVFGANRFSNFGRGLRNRVNELAYLGIAQTYDYLEDKDDLDENRDAFSDVGYELGVNPSSYFGLLWDGNWDIQDHDFSSWGMGVRFRDDRGDAITTKYNFIDENVSQIDGTLEIVLSDRLKLGFFGRFDELESEFIEAETAVRIMSSCNCWYIDVGYRERINPDNQQAMLRFTLLGLGDLVQNFGMDQFRNNNSNTP